jgi:hypothetical protein
MLLAHTWRIRVVEDHAYFGWEMGRVARALATGRGYADPFLGRTGPTAWVSPLYPLLLAAIFKLFGVYSNIAALVTLALNCFFSALVTLTTFAIARRSFNERVAVWAAWLWALYPPSMQFATRSIWETTLSTLLLSCAMVVTLKLRGVGQEPETGLRNWLLLGLLSGLLALSNPSTLLFLLACGVWILAAPHSRNIFGATLAVALCLVMVAPWMLRNQRVFHHFIPMRTNAGAEFYLGNGPGATGLVMEYDHPFFDAQALARYRQQGELAYSQQQGIAAWLAVRQNPSRFAGLVARRVYFFWFGVPHEAERTWSKAIADWSRVALFSFTSLAGLFGLALAVRCKLPAAPMFMSAFVLLPLVYYFVFVHARFRHPVEPLIAILGVWLFQTARSVPGLSARPGQTPLK